MTDSRSAPRRLAAVALFLVGVAAFVAIIYLLGLDKVDTILDSDLRFVALAFGVGLPMTMTTAFRWGSITNSIAGRKALTYPQYYASLIVGRVVGLFVSRSGGELGVRVVTITGLGKTSTEVAAASVTLDRLFDLTLPMALLPASLLILTGRVSAEAGAVLLPISAGAAVLVMLRLDLLMRWVARALSRVVAKIGGPPALRRFSQARVLNLEELAEVEHLPPKEVLVLAWLTIQRYIANVALLYFLAEAFGLDISFYTMLVAGPLMQLALIVGFTPGGLGFFEAGTAYALALGDVSSSEAAVFLVGQRAFQYTFFPIVAAISYLALLRPNRMQEAKGAAEATLRAGSSGNTP